MPKPIKKRIKKKSGIEEEEVKGKAIETLHLLKQKRRTLIYLVSGIIAFVIFVAAFLFYTSSNAKEAYNLETKAFKYYYATRLKQAASESDQSTDAQTDRWEKALDLFKKAYKKKSTPVTLFYIGNCYYNLGDNKNAIKTYQEFINSYSENEEIIPLVYQKLASTYRKTGNLKEAYSTLDSLSSYREGMFKDTALILKARYLESEGRQEEAEKIYKEIINNYPNSLWNLEAKSKIDTESPDEAMSEEVIEQPEE
jgi:tetratricopeptide (TPR) repeat protein